MTARLALGRVRASGRAFLPVAEERPAVCTHHFSFSRLSVGGHWGGFCPLVITNNTARSIWDKLWWGHMFSFLWGILSYLAVGLLGPVGVQA